MKIKIYYLYLNLRIIISERLWPYDCRLRLRFIPLLLLYSGKCWEIALRFRTNFNKIHYICQLIQFVDTWSYDTSNSNITWKNILQYLLKFVYIFHHNMCIWIWPQILFHNEIIRCVKWITPKRKFPSN